MARSSYLQTNFQGGQWSPYAQGRADEEGYRTALNRSFNALPIESGAHTRRPGTQAPATTRNGNPGVVREFNFSQNAPFDIEFTDNHIRLWAGTSLLLSDSHAIVSISSANPAVVRLIVAADWATLDQIEIAVTPIGGPSPLGVAPLFNRQFSLTKIDSTHFSLSDPVTGLGLDGSTLNLTGWQLTGARIVDFATPYVFGSAWKTTQVRVVQDEDTAFILVPGFAPRVLQNVNPLGAPVFSFFTPTFLDGPYLDPPTDASTLTPNATSGDITLTASALTSINGGSGFLSTDVGRMVRLFSEPANWASGTVYTAGQNVRFLTGAGPAYYTALTGNHGVEPDLDAGINWAPSTTAAAWTWGLITSVTDTSHVHITLTGSLTDIYQQPLAGGNLLYTNAVAVWQLGSWSNTTSWPTCGGFAGGRFFFAGAVNNRFDATMSNQNFNFAPTLLDGTPADNNGLTETIKGKQRNTTFWIEPVAEGVVLGTQGGEWLVQASSLNEPITPTSVKADPVTSYGCANVEPVQTGLSMVFVQRYQKQVYEYLADVYSRKFSGTNLARRARNLTAPGIVELAYTKENAPVLWARTAQDQLLTCTYKRSSPFATQTPADFFGWSYHTLGSKRLVQSIAAGPSPDGSIDTLCLVTQDPTTGIHYVEFETPVFEETSAITAAWFLDGALTPQGAEIKTVNGKLSVVFYGLQILAGDVVTAWIGGIDAGDYTISAAGTITVPVDGSANPLLTQAALAGLNGGSFGTLGVSILVTPPGQGFFTPVGSALPYTTSSSPASNGGSGIVDFDANRGYFLQSQHSGDPGTNGYSLFIFNLTSQAQLFGPLDPGQLGFNGSLNAAKCLGYDGNIYLGSSSDGTHHASRYNATTHANDVTYNDPHGLGGVGYIAPLTFGGQQFVVCTTVNSGATGSGVDIIQMTGSGAPTWTGVSFVVDEAPGSLAPGNAFPCRGPNGAGYILSVGPPFGLGTQQLGIYRTQADGFATDGSAVGMAKIGVVLPTAVNAGWTSIGLPIGGNVFYDETDGNLITCVEGSDSTFRIIKISTTTAAVLWQIAVGGSVDFRQSRVRGGRFTYLTGSSPYTLTEINTLTGGTTAGPTESAIAPNEYAHDDKLGLYVSHVSNAGQPEWATFGPAVGGGTITPALYYTVPAVIGFNYISQGQILRPLLPQEIGSSMGPGLGKTKRSHMYSALLANTQGIKVGTDFSHMRKANLVTPGRTQTIANNVLFTDVIQDTLEDTASFHSMWAWQTDRPYPTTVVSVEGFIETSER